MKISWVGWSTISSSPPLNQPATKEPNLLGRIYALFVLLRKIVEIAGIDLLEGGWSCLEGGRLVGGGRGRRTNGPVWALQQGRLLKIQLKEENYSKHNMSAPPPSKLTFWIYQPDSFEPIFFQLNWSNFGETLWLNLTQSFKLFFILWSGRMVWPGFRDRPFLGRNIKCNANCRGFHSKAAQPTDSSLQNWRPFNKSTITGMVFLMTLKDFERLCCLQNFHFETFVPNLSLSLIISFLD